ncbi:hypothetical protein Tco_0277263 [Tanacetum coccineum]
MAQFWHTLKEDGSKHRLKFLLDRKELTLTLDDFRTIFYIPKENDNNHASLADVLQVNILQVLDYKNALRDGTTPPFADNAKYVSEELWGLDVPLTHHTDWVYLRETHEDTYATLAEEIEKLVEDPKNVDDSSPPRHDDTSIPGTRLEPRSDKESPEVEIVQEKEVEPDKDTPMVDVTNIVTPVNVDDEEDEITDEVFELRRRVKGKNVEETRISPIPSPTRSPRNLSTLVSSDTEKLQELTVTHPTPSSGSSEPKLTKTNRLLSLIKAKPNRFKRYKSFFHELQGRYGYLFAHLKKRFQGPLTSSDHLHNLHDVMMETLPSLVKEKVTEQVKKEVPAQVRDQVPVYLVEGLILERKTTKEETERLISKAILQERGLHPAQVQSSSVPEQQHQLYLAMKADPLLQQQDIAIWLALQMKFEKTQQTDSYDSDDDEIPTKQVTQDIMEEIYLTIDEAKLKKMADEMLR